MKDKIYKSRLKIYATSAAGSVAEEGAESSAADTSQTYL
jgi:hypothetical protein